MVEIAGMGGPETGLRQYRSLEDGKRFQGLADEQVSVLDRRVTQVIQEAQDRAAKILKENRQILVTLRDLLIEKKIIEAKTLKTLVGPEVEQLKTKVRGEAEPAEAQ